MARIIAAADVVVTDPHTPQLRHRIERGRVYDLDDPLWAELFRCHPEFFEAGVIETAAAAPGTKRRRGTL